MGRFPRSPSQWAAVAGLLRPRPLVIESESHLSAAHFHDRIRSTVRSVSTFEFWVRSLGID